MGGWSHCSGYGSCSCHHCWVLFACSPCQGRWHQHADCMLGALLTPSRPSRQCADPQPCNGQCCAATTPRHAPWRSHSSYCACPCSAGQGSADTVSTSARSRGGHHNDQLSAPVVGRRLADTRTQPWSVWWRLVPMHLHIAGPIQNKQACWAVCSPEAEAQLVLCWAPYGCRWVLPGGYVTILLAGGLAGGVVVVTVCLVVAEGAHSISGCSDGHFGGG